MSNSTQRPVTLIIRPVRNDEREIQQVAQMQFNAYWRQFYDPSGPLKGALGQEFPILKSYETIEPFVATWRKLAKMVTSPNPTGYAYVAFLSDTLDDGAKRERPVAIVKNMVWQAGADLCENLTVYGKARRLADVAELGSIYVDVSMQGKGLGSILIQRVAMEGLQKGFSQMVTRAYARNISPEFFVKKTFGKLMGECRIPYGYDPDLLAAKGLVIGQMPTSIPGVWIFWDKSNLIRAAEKPMPPSLEKGYTARPTGEEARP